MSDSRAAQNLLMRNVPLSLSRSKSRSKRGNLGRSPHPSTDCSGLAAHRRNEPTTPASMDGSASLRWLRGGR